jgi:hypothetical protein
MAQVLAHPGCHSFRCLQAALQNVRMNRAARVIQVSELGVRVLLGADRCDEEAVGDKLLCTAATSHWRLTGWVLITGADMLLLPVVTAGTGQLEGVQGAQGGGAQEEEEAGGS